MEKWSGLSDTSNPSNGYDISQASVSDTLNELRTGVKSNFQRAYSGTAGSYIAVS